MESFFPSEQKLMTHSKGESINTVTKQMVAEKELRTVQLLHTVLKLCLAGKGQFGMEIDPFLRA